MRQLSNRDATRSLRLLVSVLFVGVALLASGCDNDVVFRSPTAPRTPWAPVGDRTLQVSGSLEAIDGTCFAATVFYDGREVEEARVTCPEEAGCGAVELRATIETDAGHHTLSFMVLSQSEEVVEYWATGSVTVFRENLFLTGATLPLGPTRAKLGVGDEIAFELQFEDWD